MNEANKQMPNKDVELVVPAGGTMAHVKAAVHAGADAIYLGIRSDKRYSLLYPIVEYPISQMEKIVRLCHAGGCRVYVAFNGYYNDPDYEPLMKRIFCLADLGVDAFIVTDLALVRQVVRENPAIELHAIEQMGTSNVAGVEFLKSLGIRQVILERLLSLQEIAQIKQRTRMRLEVFVFGGMCSSYHTFCNVPNYLYGTTCLSACMDQYSLRQGDKEERGHFLKSRSLNALHLIPSLIQAGVNALKVEGRTKNPRYTRRVTRTFRDVIDQVLETGKAKVDPKAGRVLYGQVPPRSSSGYLEGPAGPESMLFYPKAKDHYWDYLPFVGFKSISWYLTRRKLRRQMKRYLRGK